MPYQVRTDAFEGPLDLLLYLVTREKLDITEVSLAKVAEDYWAYLKLLQDLDLDMESSYLVVFACLLEVKSRLLLPPEPDQEVAVEDLDLSSDTEEHDLVDRLREYKRFKEASQALMAREQEAMQVFTRPAAEEAGMESALDVSLPDLMEALRGLLEAHEKQKRKRTRLRVERVSVSVPQRMQEILDMVSAPATGPMQFSHLFDGEATRQQIIVTFLAILELARLRRIRVWQDERAGPIFVEGAELSPPDQER